MSKEQVYNTLKSSAIALIVLATGFSPADSTRSQQIATQIDSRLTNIRSFFEDYVTYIDPGSMIVTKGQVKINKDPFNLTKFEQVSRIGLELGDTYIETYGIKGDLLTGSFRTDRTRVNLPGLNSAINEVNATEGSDSPKLAALNEQFLRQAFKFPRDTKCFNGKMEADVGGDRNVGQKAGLYTWCSTQIETQSGSFNLQAATMPNGDTSFKIYSTALNTCGPLL